MIDFLTRNPFELFLNQIFHVGLKLFKVELSIGFQTHLLRNLSPNVTIDMTRVLGTVRKYSAKLLLAYPPITITVQGIKCLLQVIFLEQEFRVECSMTELSEVNLIVRVLVNVCKDLRYLSLLQLE